MYLDIKIYFRIKLQIVFLANSKNYSIVDYIFHVIYIYPSVISHQTYITNQFITKLPYLWTDFDKFGLKMLVRMRYSTFIT